MLRFTITCLLALAACCDRASAVDPTLPSGPPPKEGRIYNLDTQPFAFRLARKTGRTWTDVKTVAPGEVYAIRTDSGGEVDALEGITRDGSGHVTIEYAELGGKMRIQLPAVDLSKNVYATHWFHVRDANGFSRLIQAENQAEAEQRRKTLLAQKPLTDVEIDRLKKTLRANFVFYDR